MQPPDLTGIESHWRIDDFGYPAILQWIGFVMCGAPKSGFPANFLGEVMRTPEPASRRVSGRWHRQSCWYEGHFVASWTGKRIPVWCRENQTNVAVGRPVWFTHCKAVGLGAGLAVRACYLALSRYLQEPPAKACPSSQKLRDSAHDNGFVTTDWHRPKTPG
jgi:hypothetical protein